MWSGELKRIRETNWLLYVDITKLLIKYITPPRLSEISEKNVST
jgi:hypothetical protein